MKEHWEGVALLFWSLLATSYFLPKWAKMATREPPHAIFWHQVLIGFLIFFSLQIFVPISLQLAAQQVTFYPFLAYAIKSIAIPASFFSTCFFLWFYCKSQCPEAIQKRQKPLYYCLKGAASWLFAYPNVMLVAYAVAFLIAYFSSEPLAEQAVVQQLREAMHHPFAFWLTIIAVVTAVPMGEEILFRGLLQTWLRRWLACPYAVIITSAFFAFFHFAADQGLANIQIIFALFFLALILGLLREKYNSLWTPIGLHITFNAVSTALLIQS